MAIIGDCSAPAMVVVRCRTTLGTHSISPPGAVRRSDRLSPRSSDEPERMRRTPMASGERE